MHVSSRFTTRSALVNVMTAAIEKAARGLVRDFGEVEQLQVSRKGLGDFVSTADHRSEDILISELRKARPKFGFITEESGEIPGEDPTQRWIIDPLDGTTNFLHGIPHFAITVALQMNDEIIAGVTYDPIKDEMFWAEKGRGTFLNQRRIRVSGRRQFDEALVGIGAPFGHYGDPELFKERLTRVLPHAAGVRRMGAASLDLAYVACGRFDVFFEEPMHIWDYAAGILMVQEAGGIVTDIKGQQKTFEANSIVAGNAEMHATLMKKLKA
ncbi:MAG: inositol monophosphatase family protein [Pseudomonadota bacterium]